MKGYLVVVAGAVLLAVPAVATAEDPSADLVLLHGKIHTEDAKRSVAQGLAVRGHTIVAVGTDQEIGARIGPRTRTIDLGGRVVLPGIIDAHTHPAESAQEFAKCSLGDVMIAPEELKTRVAACLKSHPGDKKLWFEVVQVNPSGLTLTRKDLDSILPDLPMILSGSDGHSVWANSAALRAAHISAGTRDPLAGRIERDAAGNPTGTLRDEAADLVLHAKPAPGLDLQVSRLDKAFDAMRATGITSVQDASVDEHDMQLYKRLYDARRLNILALTRMALT
jgi:predicted amidohydrolase YtcJ